MNDQLSLFATQLGERKENTSSKLENIVENAPPIVQPADKKPTPILQANDQTTESEYEEIPHFDVPYVEFVENAFEVYRNPDGTAFEREFYHHENPDGAIERRDKDEPSYDEYSTIRNLFEDYESYMGYSFEDMVAESQMLEEIDNFQREATSGTRAEDRFEESEEYLAALEAYENSEHSPEDLLDEYAEEHENEEILDHVPSRRLEAYNVDINATGRYGPYAIVTDDRTIYLDQDKRILRMEPNEGVRSGLANLLTEIYDQYGKHDSGMQISVHIDHYHNH